MTEANWILDIGAELVGAACAAGADQAEAYLRYGPSTRITWQHNCTSQSNGWESNLALRVWRNGQAVTHTTSDFTSVRLETLARQACVLLEHHGVRDASRLPEASSPLIFPLEDETTVTLAEKIAAVRTLPANIGTNWSLATTILNVSYEEETLWTSLVNSHGFKSAYQNTRYSIWAWLEGKSGHLVTATSSQRFADLNLTAIGEYLHEQATLKQQSNGITPHGHCQVLMPPIAAAHVAQTLGTLLTGENILQSLRPLAKRLDKPIAAPTVTLVDDSMLANGVKSRPIDDEGTITQATTLIEKGVLKNVLHTRQTADQMNVQPNGKATRSNLWQPPHSAPSNIYLQAGDTAPTAIRQELENGLIVTGVLEKGRIQGVAGTFVMIVQGYWVKDRQTVGYVDQARLSINIFELLRNVRVCGTDFQFSPLTPGAGAPSLLIEGVQIG